MENGSPTRLGGCAGNLKLKASCLTEHTAKMEQFKTKPNLVETGELFRSTNDRVSKFAEAQVRLYRHDVNLQHYFHALDFNMLYGKRGVPAHASSINPLAAWSFHAAYKARRIARPR
jgi:hypothetical protein